MATTKETPTPAPGPSYSFDPTDVIGRLKAQRAILQKTLKETRADTEAIRKQNADLTARIADLEKRAGGGAAERVKELEAQIRERAHRDVFDRIATQKGGRPEALNDLWRLSEYTPEADVADEATIGSLIDTQKSERAYLFGPASPNGAPAPPPPPRKPGVGSGQGAPNPAPGQVPAPDDPRWSDVRWQWDNFDKIAQAASERRERGEV